MELSRVEIRQGVWLTHLREDKFKTACFSVNLLSQLSRETASMNALIPFVLRAFHAFTILIGQEIPKQITMSISM